MSIVGDVEESASFHPAVAANPVDLDHKMREVWNAFLQQHAHMQVLKAVRMMDATSPPLQAHSEKCKTAAHVEELMNRVGPHRVAGITQNRNGFAVFYWLPAQAAQAPSPCSSSESTVETTSPRGGNG